MTSARSAPSPYPNLVIRVEYCEVPKEVYCHRTKQDPSEAVLRDEIETLDLAVSDIRIQAYHKVLGAYGIQR